MPKIEHFRYEVVQTLNRYNEMELKISVRTNKGEYTQTETYFEDHFESLFERLVRDATEKIKQVMLEKE